MVVRVPVRDDVVDVSVVSWNSWPHLSRNLPALVAQDYPAYRIVVVDNASSDASADEVEAHFPDVTVVRSARNGGYGAGNNIGFAQSQSKYIAVVNPDARPEPGWLRALVRAGTGPAGGAGDFEGAAGFGSRPHQRVRPRRAHLGHRVLPPRSARSSTATSARSMWLRCRAPRSWRAAMCSKRSAASTSASSCTWRTRSYRCARGSRDTTSS